MSSRLAFLYMTGDWPLPRLEMDHINRDKTDDSWNNLRIATSQQNKANTKHRPNKLGIRGVRWDRGAYRADIKVNNKNIYLGRFKNLDDAKKAYNGIAKKYFGEFAYL